METLMISTLLGYGSILLVALTQLQRACSAERREKQYRQMCDDLQGALKRQGDALQNLMTATERLRNAQNASDQRPGPMWVEWLMGYPLGWTDCEDSETQSSRKSQP